MNDLISRKAVKKMLSKKFGGVKNIHPMNDGIVWIQGGRTDMFWEIDQIPIAYDMDKIVEQLENLKKCYIGDETAVMKPTSFEEYIQEIIDITKGETTNEQNQ